MDRRPETVSFGHPGGPHRGARWTWLVLGLLLIAVAARLATLAAGRGGPGPRPSPGVSGTAVHRFPDGSDAWFSVTATAVNSKTDRWPTLRLSIRGHGQRGQRYGLLGGLCSGQFVTPSDWAEATADSTGDLRFVAPDVPGSLTDPHLFMFVYRLADGVTLGGIKGPLLGAATPFTTMPPC